MPVVRAWYKYTPLRKGVYCTLYQAGEYKRGTGVYSVYSERGSGGPTIGVLARLHALTRGFWRGVVFCCRGLLSPPGGAPTHS